LQYKDYPEFFNSHELSERDTNLNLACEKSDQLVCISNFVKSTVLKYTKFDESKIVAIPILLPHRFPQISDEHKRNVLKKFLLNENDFLLYPANFWAHKNHKILLTAFGIFLKKHPASSLKLVLTGSPSNEQKALKDAVEAMSLSERVIFTGYLSNDDMEALMQTCKAIIFPSLYEGFGMPLVEAFAHKKPVLCSNVTSLPEVGEDAVFYFDPRKPDDIVRTIEQLIERPDLVQTMLEKANERLSNLGSSEDMARSYIEVFQRAIRERL
jgi:glycosyltransferase involved in cell wall biosynthesis